MQDGSTVTVQWSGMSWARPYRNANSVGGAPSRASQIVKLKILFVYAQMIIKPHGL